MAVGTPWRAVVVRIVLGLVGGIVMMVPGSKHPNEITREMSDGGELERRDDKEGLEKRDKPARGTSRAASNGALASGHGPIVLAQAAGVSS